MRDYLQARRPLKRSRPQRQPALSLTRALAATRFCLCLIAAVFVQTPLIPLPAARAFSAHPGPAGESPRARVITQGSGSGPITERARLLIDEIRTAAYPELRDAEIEVKLFESRSDYFRARFAVPRFVTGRPMRYIVFVNAGAFTRQAPTEGLRAIVAHELAHVLYFKQRKRIRLLGLVRLATKGFTTRFERRADLQAIARGYGEGLQAYRLWLYQNIPAKRVEEKKRNYFSPEEIDAIVAAVQQRPELMAYWLKHVPRSLKDILAEKIATEKR